jgi:plasmid stabilization system protein ParE
MRPYSLSEEAEADLESILGYTARQWGLQQAERYAEALEQAFILMAKGHTPLARPLPNLPDVVVFRCQHHYVFAQPRRGRVVILAILHENMDFMRHLHKRLPR